MKIHVFKLLIIFIHLSFNFVDWANDEFNSVKLTPKQNIFQCYLKSMNLSVYKNVHHRQTTKLPAHGI